MLSLKVLTHQLPLPATDATTRTKRYLCAWIAMGLAAVITVVLAAIMPVQIDITSPSLLSIVVLHVDKNAVRVSPKDLGLRVDTVQTDRRAHYLSHRMSAFDRLTLRLQSVLTKSPTKLSPSFLVNLPKARAHLERLKPWLEKTPQPSRLDFTRKKLISGQSGVSIDTDAALAAMVVALGFGQFDIYIPYAKTPALMSHHHRNLKSISHELATFSTAFSTADKDKNRAFNLKVAADKIDGYVLHPGETFSFNQVVGPRTEAEGYRIAPTIMAGELIDGVAGGSCQLSSTLFAAAFFAGLELVSSRPHTIPSHYIKLGLDAAVAYPETDLVIKNPYSFPVALHLTVSQGQVKVDIFGEQRPFRRITFRRVIVERLPFSTVERPDANIPLGKQVIEQHGLAGFVVERQRIFYPQNSRSVEKRILRYPPTPQIVRIGTGPQNSTWQAPPEKMPYGDVPAEFELSQ